MDLRNRDPMNKLQWAYCKHHCTVNIEGNLHGVRMSRWWAVNHVTGDRYHTEDVWVKRFHMNYRMLDKMYGDDYPVDERMKKVVGDWI